MTSINSLSGLSATTYSSAARAAGKGEQLPMPPMPPMPPTPEKKGDCPPIPVLPLYNKVEFKEIVVTSEDVKVTFFVENKELFNTPEETGKLIVIADLVRQLNPYVHGEPVLKVRILDTQEFIGEYLSAEHEILLSKKVLNEADYLHTIAHEMGHAIDCSMPKDKEFWQKLYIYSLGFGRYGLVADSNYTLTGGYYGHPFRGSHELFASAFAAYVMHPEELLECINDPGLLESTRLMGKILYCYIRDNIFGGRVFGKEDPFKAFSANELFDSITEEDIYLSIASALRDRTSCAHHQSVANRAAGILLSLAMKDDRYFRLLAASAKDNDVGLRKRIILEIGSSGIKEERLNCILIGALRDKNELIRGYAEATLKYRGIEVRRNIFARIIDAIF